MPTQRINKFLDKHYNVKKYLYFFVRNKIQQIQKILDILLSFKNLIIEDGV